MPTTGAKTYDGMAVPLLGESNIKQQVAGTDVLTITLMSGATGRPFVINNSSNSAVFSIAPSGAIRTFAAFSTLAVASIASAGSQSYTVTGATTDDAVLLLPLKTPTANNGVATAFVGTADRIDIFVGGLSWSSLAANTFAVWLFRTVANSLV